MTPDPIFGDPLLAALYDTFDGARDDLNAYLTIVREAGARSVLDVGCGTGCLALLLAAAGCAVTAVDPAAASLDVARAKPDAERVRWIEGDATTLPPVAVDLAVMTGNVAQVFLTDDAWLATLVGIHAALRPGGLFVFETRRVADRAWERWSGRTTRDVPGLGAVQAEFSVTDVQLPLVSFTHTYTFPDGTVRASPSTLRFRDRDEVVASLSVVGFECREIRDAPDRPGAEDVYLATRR